MTVSQQTEQFLSKTAGCCGVWLLPKQWAVILLALHFAAEEDLISIIMKQLEQTYYENMPNITGSN